MPATTTSKEPAAVALPKNVTALHTVLSKMQDAYVDRLPASRTHFERSLQAMPGGNTRSVLFTAPFPVFMKNGRGNRLWDQDGNEYIDLAGELTAGLYGHSHPVLQQTVLSAYKTVGVNLGATTTEEVAFAEAIKQRFPRIEKLRFCNSGTEANLYALAMARHATGHRKIVVFDGAYHGGVLSFGHGIAEHTVDRQDWLLGRFNDVKGARKLIETPGVAAVIVEAMQGAGGCLPASTAFLQSIQKTAKRCGVVFILDEVMTSRLHPGGLQALYTLEPDVITLGKYVGGGLAFGAFGGRASLLTSYDPRLPDSLSHSGTFNNNTLVMATGRVGLTEVYTPECARLLNASGDRFRAKLQDAAQHTKMVVTGIGAVLAIHFLRNGDVPVCATDISEQTVPGLQKLFWYWCLQSGFWITERGMLSIILGTTDDELDRFINVVRAFILEYGPLIKLV